ncbi:Cleavage and polyadenylation specificity factor subunit 3-I [Castilleja foliolosa]|uniref:Cleavage and polyadenylation specificity factor subunit 3-I n=1 Tax=Castilleja foliolosa TaxID=1961234 RepID=A0ABD3BB53_9LAMI
MAPEDLHIFSQLSTGNVIQRITIPYSGAFGVIKHRLKKIYESVESSFDEELRVPVLKVHSLVTVKQESENHLSLHWAADPINDIVLDLVVALVLNASRELPKVVVESDHETTEEEKAKNLDKIIHSILVSQFVDVKYVDDGKLMKNVDGNVGHLDKWSGEVESENEALKERVRRAF